MFEKLIESTMQKQRGRTGSMLLMTGLIYLVVMTAVGVATVFWFNPALAESNRIAAILAPPPPPGPPPPVVEQPREVRSNAVDTSFRPPETPQVLLNPTTIPVTINKPVSNIDYVPGGTPYNGNPVGSGIPGSTRGNEATPPPPPTPRPTPAPTPEKVQTPKEPLKVSIGVLQGKAVRKVSPPYPSMGKAVRAQGAVQVQVTISEEGRVIEAYAINGHPLLREASVQAARQWIFTPTTLSNVPVKVQGILTFNFTLN